MTYMPRLEAATTADWPDLVAEFDRWGEAGRVAGLWWRDDDAAGWSPRLADLLRLGSGAPIALAVIPAPAGPDLAEALQQAPQIAVLQHGWSHANRAAHGKKSEYPAGRPAATVAAELAAGRARMKELFGMRRLPVLVPPWNRIASSLLTVVRDSGFAAVSAMASKEAAAFPPGLAPLDVHVDVTDWRGDRGFVGRGPVLARLIGWLKAQRLGQIDASGPIGVLTHHLVMDSATAAFLDGLNAQVAAHPAARWTDIARRWP
jgi:hypothetical protein